MKAGEVEQPLQEEALREIELSLYGKLKAHRVSDAFIDRWGQDAIQKGLLEYLRAREAGVEIQNRDAFVVRAAFCRAIDELRHEARQADMAVDALIDSGRQAAPPSEELALEHLQAEELQAAIGELPPEERQILVLHYFEHLSVARSAELLYCSERTYRRRLERALKALGQRLGAPTPEPGSEFAFEVGLAAWISLGGAQVALAHGPLEHLGTLLDRGREGLDWATARLRDPLARADASGTSERVGAILGGPAGKVAGGCAAAAIACTLGGVIGPGIGAHRPAEKPEPSPPAPAVRTSPAPAASAAAPQTLATSRSGESQPAPEQAPPEQRRRSRKQRQQARNDSERRQVERQTSGIARAAAESTAAPETQASSVESETVTVTPTEEGPSSSESAEKEFSFEQQP